MGCPLIWKCCSFELFRGKERDVECYYGDILGKLACTDRARKTCHMIFREYTLPQRPISVRPSLQPRIPGSSDQAAQKYVNYQEYKLVM